MTTTESATSEQTVSVDDSIVPAVDVTQREAKYENKLIQENFIKVAKRSKAWLLAMNE